MWSQWGRRRRRSSTVHFGKEQLMWPVLKGPKGPDQPWRLLSKQSNQSWTSQLQLRLWLVTQQNTDPPPTEKWLNNKYLFSYKKILQWQTPAPPPPLFSQSLNFVKFLFFETTPYKCHKWQKRSAPQWNCLDKNLLFGGVSVLADYEVTIVCILLIMPNCLQIINLSCSDTNYLTRIPKELTCYKNTKINSMIFLFD